MPKKGEKLTEEHKAAMQEGRERVRQEKAERIAEAEAHQAEAEEAKAQAQQEAIERAQEVRRKMLEEDISPADEVTLTPGAPTHAPTYQPTGQASDQSVAEWGPYNQYVIAETPYGRFGVEPGYVMFFETYTFFDDRAKQMRQSHRPVYIWHGNGPDDKDYGKTRDELVRGLAPGERRPPKVAVPTGA